MSGAAAVAIAPIVFVTDVPAENDLVPAPAATPSKDREISEPVPLMRLVPKPSKQLPPPIPKPTPASGQAWERARTPSSGIPIRMAKGLRRGAATSSADESNVRSRPTDDRDIQWDELTPLMERPERFSEVVPKGRRNDERTPRVGHKTRPSVPWPTAPEGGRAPKSKSVPPGTQVPARRAATPQREPVRPASASKTLVGQHPAPWLLDDHTPVKAPAKSGPRATPTKPASAQAVPATGIRKAMMPPPMAAPLRKNKVVEPSSGSTRVPPSVRTPLNSGPMVDEITRVGRPAAQRARSTAPAKTSRPATSASSAHVRPQATRPQGQVVSSIPSRSGGTFVGRVLPPEPVSARALVKSGSTLSSPAPGKVPPRRGPSADARPAAPLSAVPTKIERPQVGMRSQPTRTPSSAPGMSRGTEGSGTRRRPQPPHAPSTVRGTGTPLAKVQPKRVAASANTRLGDRSAPRESMVAPKPSAGSLHDPDKTPIQGPPPLPAEVLEELEWARARAAAQRAIDEEEAAWERALAAAKLRHQ